MAHTQVAIIVGCYKQEEYVKQALYSAENQIVPHYAKFSNLDLPSFQVIESHDGCRHIGTSASAHRNRAIAAVDADWIIWLDADDLIPSNFLYELWHSLGVDKSCIAISTPMQQFITGCRLDVVAPIKLRDYPEIISSETEEGVTILNRSYPLVITSLFAKKAWHKVKGFDENMQTWEDLDFWIKLRNLGGRLHVSSVTHLLRRNIKPLPFQRSIEEQEKFALKVAKAQNHFLVAYGLKMKNGLFPYLIPPTTII